MRKEKLTYDNPKVVLRSAIVDLPQTKEDWILHARWSDIRPSGFVEALCPHGVGHHKGVHGCHMGDDGQSCCTSCPSELWAHVSED